MTHEDKQLLLIDLCARLPYGVVVELDEKFRFNKGTRPLVKELLDLYCVEGMKPYLRPMSSMTEEEKEYYYTFIDEFSIDNRYPQFTAKYVNKKHVDEYIDWLNRKMFDYRGLIPEGLALEAPDGMYKH